MKKIFFICIILQLTLLSLTVSAQIDKIYHLKLLAVEGEGENMAGSDADLYLELREGSGRVFLDTYPLTKLDTQISTRFAKDIACKHFKIDCNKYDFIYTIKAKSNIIGGPSAGAAIAALTTIATLDLNYDDSISITGTINSGGIIGPVGGVEEKLQAASRIGLDKVLIAKGTSLQPLTKLEEEIEIKNENITNQTIPMTKINVSIEENISIENDTNITQPSMNMTELSENLSLEIVEVMDLDEVVYHFTGVDLNNKEINITTNQEYTEIMQGLQRMLCSRTKEIEDEIVSFDIKINESFYEGISNKKGKAENATKIGDYYSAASFCFGNNIQLKRYYYEQKEFSQEIVDKFIAIIEQKLANLEKKIEQEKIDTISDLQTLSVVKERLNDVKEKINKMKGGGSLEELYSLLAYTEERFYSALSWMQFFSMEGKKYVLNEEVLHNACLQKISESEERHQYASLYLPGEHTSQIKDKIDTARKAMENQEFALCLITASQAKADSNAVLSSIGLRDESIDEYLESKRQAVEIVIAENSAEDIFPILGYSYYNYAQALQEQDKYTSLVYLEYALELSELSIYFPEKQKYLEAKDFASDKILGLSEETILIGEGFLLGVLFTLLIIKLRKKKQIEHRREDYFKS